VIPVKQNSDFHDFISLSCDRVTFIRNFLKKRNIETSLFKTGEKTHIFVRFPQNQYDPTFKTKTVIAHYDRVYGSQGANDNSFAVFVLMEWAEELSKASQPHNIRLIFTDGEEASEGIKSQGAFELAAWFRKLQIDKGDVFVFDCMGRGNTPVLCQTNLPEKVSGLFKQSFSSLEKKGVNILSAASDKWLTLPTAYSDNAGFLAAGIPAITFTMLPSREAENYLKLLMKTKAQNMDEVYKAEYKEDLKQLYPPTWFLINSHRDSLETLTEESEEITRKILERIYTLKSLA